MYKEFIIIFIIIIFHELGHFLVSKIFNWEIDKIYIYPYGGCVKFNEKINRPLYQELLIMLGGPFFQIILFLIIKILFSNNFISMRNYLLFNNYHYTLLFFNLLPIYPLDGGKLVNILCNYFFPYKKGNKIIIYLSYLLIIFILLFNRNLNLLLISVFIINQITIYLKNQNYFFNKFLLERYINNYKFKDTKIINNKDNMYRGKKHIFKIKNKYIKEKEYLNNRFKEKL